MENRGGRPLCQDMTQTLHFIKPSAVLIAEYWNHPREGAVWPPPRGMGFDLGYADGIRDAVRGILAEARGGADARINLLPLQQAPGAPAPGCLPGTDVQLPGKPRPGP